ncbi:MAG: GntR family transcriptional regulator [Halofilum sp. (in: g-proteobacteria)]|nr:GntR family transcriptional regulator [Halofilum sp. (in: g-proteobacteria)]
MPRNLTKEALYDELRRRIVTMELEPGTDLDEAELSSFYAMSRTPVREILIRLQGEGLVVQRRNRGAMVAPLDMGTLQSWFEAGRMIHRAMVRLAAHRRTEQDLEAIHGAMEAFEQATRERDKLQMLYSNERFHDLVGRAARNAYLYASYRRVIADHERISELCYSYEVEGHAQHDLDGHRRLCDALAAGDADTAEQVIDAHLSRAREGLRDALARWDDALSRLSVPEA